jgi:putative spermidine/putrescine transport system permease protein
VLAKWGLRFLTLAVLAFLYVPIVIIVMYSFNDSRAQVWPIVAWTTRWYDAAFGNSDFRDALWLSIQAGIGATILALALGSLAALAVHRFRFFGREAISFALVLPLALPGIVTGIALSASINTLALNFGLATIVIGHATFCVVVVYNNVIARLRRSSSSIEEASMDLGATSLQTFRYVTFPVLGTALLAGGMLAFALSFDEIIVTNFTAGTDQTLPIWIFSNVKLPNQRPIVNVVAVIVIILSAIPVYLAQRLAGPDSGASHAAP